jgi:hypothetical protein
MKSGRVCVLLLATCVLLSITPAVFAKEIQENEVPSLLRLDPGKKHGSTETVKHQSKGFLDRLDLLNWGVNNDRADQGKRIRTVSLYPQSFSASKPVAHQTAPARSYFLSLVSPDKESTYVGLANIDTEQRTELKGVYQKDLNAELLLGYRWAGFGSVLFGRALQYERLGEDGGRVSDMGWRIKFVKTF